MDVERRERLYSQDSYNELYEAQYEVPIHHNHNNNNHDDDDNHSVVARHQYAEIHAEESVEMAAQGNTGEEINTTRRLDEVLKNTSRRLVKSRNVLLVVLVIGLVSISCILHEHSKDTMKEMNVSVSQLQLYDQYERRFKVRLGSISFRDVLWFTKQHDADDLFVLKQLERQIDAFERMWGKGSFKAAVDVMNALDEKERETLYTSINRVRNHDRLKFVESPKNTTAIHGTFDRDEDGRVFVSGYVNIKIERKWHPIYYKYYKHPLNSDHPVQTFGDAEANVTCKTGGYTSGRFIGHEESRSTTPTSLYYVEMHCTGQEEDVTRCSKYHHYNHWLSNVQIKCYI